MKLQATASVIVAAYNAGEFLKRCLESLALSSEPPFEIIVVDDCSTDDTAAVAAATGALVLRTPVNSGPAVARNLGAQRASGDILLFIDSDVLVHPDTIQRALESLQADSTLDAVIGCYDDTPEPDGFVSQYRNLMHAFVHRTGSLEAFTFWTCCGAVRRDVFLQFGGFDERYSKPSIEDIEFGYRLIAAGRRIQLHRDMEVKHLKRWTLMQMIRTDVLQRGIPWTELILRHGKMQNDLNLRVRQRLSVVVVYILLLACLAGQFAFLGAALLVAAILLNFDFYAFLVNRRGLLFAAGAVPLNLLFHLCNGVSFGIGFARLGVSGGR